MKPLKHEHQRSNLYKNTTSTYEPHQQATTNELQYTYTFGVSKSTLAGIHCIDFQMKIIKYILVSMLMLKKNELATSKVLTSE